MPDKDMFERRRDRLEGIIERRQKRTYRQFGLTESGELRGALWGYKRANAAEMRQYVESIAADPTTTHEQKIAKIIAIRPTTQAESTRNPQTEAKET